MPVVQALPFVRAVPRCVVVEMPFDRLLPDCEPSEFPELRCRLSPIPTPETTAGSDPASPITYRLGDPQPMFEYVPALSPIVLPESAAGNDRPGTRLIVVEVPFVSVSDCDEDTESDVPQLSLS